MEHYSFYSYQDAVHGPFTRCSRASAERPLMVNCAGSMATVFPFTTDNPDGRADYYLILLCSGALVVSLPGGERTLCAGDAVLFAPQTAYRYTYRGGEALHYLWVHFTGSDAARLLTAYHLDPFPAAWQLAPGNHLRADFSALFSCYLAAEPFRDDALGAVLAGLLLTLARAARDVQPAQPRLTRSIACMNADYSAPLTLPALAAMENLSVSRFSALFTAQTGLSPNRYLIRLRIDHAAELLASTDMPVKQVALSVGYTDPRFFGRLFKQITGRTPTAWRAQR